MGDDIAVRSPYEDGKAHAYLAKNATELTAGHVLHDEQEALNTLQRQMSYQLGRLDGLRAIYYDRFGHEFHGGDYAAAAERDEAEREKVRHSRHASRTA